MTTPSRPSNCSPFSPYRQCCSGMIFGSSTAGHSFLDIACRGKGGFVQQGSWHLKDSNRKTPLSGPKLVGYGHTWHSDTIAKPLCQDRNWWILGRTPHRKTPSCGPKLIGFEARPKPSQKPLYQDRIPPLGHYNDLTLGMGAFSSIILQLASKGEKTKLFLRLSRDRKSGACLSWRSFCEAP